MARTKSNKRSKAYTLWLENGGQLKLKDIAAQLGVSDSQIRKWKNQDKWDERAKVTLPNSKSNVTIGSSVKKERWKALKSRQGERKRKHCID